MNDIVTRSAVTTPSCSGASFTIISSQSGMSSSAVTPTGTSTATVTGIVPVSAGNRNVAVDAHDYKLSFARQTQSLAHIDVADLFAVRAELGTFVFW
ncbi:uncharacterized protein Triagg1_10607 [Trichoderma aggressivum f. europaeum]|uniref:Uncharacterized protein n=1 Tax=Trichoderma aggressivum f. europaeum TaxID=173218 RepID=A0AAE1I5K4_9HYPO|nr:hypothetical protein Triagg1_10607 [Trichoderma aggressivum f. europaeum]